MKKILALMAIVCLFASCSGGENGDNLPFLSLSWTWSDLAEPLSTTVRGNGKYVACCGLNGVEVALLNETDGVPAWHVEQDEKPTNETNFPPVFAGPRLIVYCSDSLKAFELVSGYELWKFQTEQTNLGPASFFEPSYDYNQIYAGTASGFLYCINAGSGIGNWKQKSRYEGFGETVNMYDKVLVRTLGSRIEAYNKSTGKLVWKNERWVLPDGKFTIDDKNLYLAVPGPFVSAIRHNSGELVWTSGKLSTNKAPLKFHPLVCQGKVVVLEGKRATLFDSATGKEETSFDLPEEPETFTTEGSSLYLTKGKMLFCVDCTGKLKGTFEEVQGDSLLGVSFSQGHVITWSPRTIYGLRK